MNTDKINKLIAEAKHAEGGNWVPVADSLHDSERWNAQVAVSENHQFVSRICECEYSEAVHIANWRPDRAIAFLEAFKAMREALGDMSYRARQEKWENSITGKQVLLKHAESAMIAADKALEELP
jgi:hypothetical protein